jgi:transposase
MVGNLVSRGIPERAALRRVGISRATYYRWRKKVVGAKGTWRGRTYSAKQLENLLLHAKETIREMKRLVKDLKKINSKGQG